MAARRRQAAGKARLLVLAAVLAAGLLIILASLFEGIHRGHSTGDPASVAFDPAAANSELEALGQKVNAALADGAVSQVLAQEVRTFVDRYPDFAPARTLYAQTLMVSGDASAAYQQLERSLALDPGQPQIHDLAAALAEKLGRHDRVGWHYSQAIALDPQRVDYRLKLANVYLRQRAFDRARELILQALRLDSDQHLAYAMLADLYASQGKLDLALDEIQKAIDHTPVAHRARQIGYIRTRAAFLRRANRPQEALQVLNSLGPQERLDPPILADLALCWSMLGQPQKAALEYEAAFEAQPTRALWAVEAARWQLKAGNQPAAAAHLATARALDPSAPGLTQLQAQDARASDFQEPGRMAEPCPP